jgi:hypothetical protein
MTQETPVITPTLSQNENILNKINEQFKDTKMGDIMKDITENILNDKTLKSPMELLSDPSKIMKLIEKTQTLLTSKVDNGDVTEQELLDNMKKSMESIGGANPMLGSLLNMVSGQLGLKGESIDDVLKDEK